MPVYNSGKYLETAINSILNQTFKEFELILVDDGSTDGSSSICDYYAKKDNRVVVLHQTNGGICKARNAALKIAQGDYIAFSDHDDKYDPNLLEENYHLAKKHNLDIIKFCKKCFTLKNEKILITDINHCEDRIILGNIKDYIFKLNKEDLLSCVWDGLFRRDFLINNKIQFDTFFRYGGEDYNFMYQCMNLANRVGTNSKSYYNHYIRQSFSTSTKFDPNKLEVLDMRFKKFHELISSTGVDVCMHLKDYTVFFYKYYIIPFIQHLNKSPLPNKKKIEYIQETKNKVFFHHFFLEYRLNAGDGLSLFIVQMLYKYNYYKTILFVYKIKDRLKKINF